MTSNLGNAALSKSKYKKDFSIEMPSKENEKIMARKMETKKDNPNEEEDMPQAKKEKKTVKSSFAKIKFVKSKEQVKSPRKTTVKQREKNCQEIRNQSNGNAGTKACDDAVKPRRETNDDKVNNTNNVNAASTNKVNAIVRKSSIELPNDLNVSELEDIVYSDDDEDVEDPKKTLVDLPNGKRAIGTKWVFRNKKDERGIVIKNKARLVAQRYTQEEGIDYDEVFSPLAGIEAIRLFLAYASFKDFVVYQMNVKSAFLYGKIEEEVYVCQPPGFEDPDFSNRVYKVEKTLYGLHQAPRDWTASKVEGGSNFYQSRQDEDGAEVDVHLYRSMIGSFMYLTSSRPAITYLKGQPKLGLWYPKDSPFDLVAYTDSDYAGASLDRKSTTG
ncbi:retrovirus-related pol polyprotein from transposon TNT 1-94, partial [Tanacetum coccineum]